MSYTVVPSVVTGQTYPASSYNTYIKDNIAALWPFTAAGDLAYAANATSLSRLAKPANTGILTNNSAGTVAWLNAAVANALKVVRVNAGGTAFELGAASIAVFSFHDETAHSYGTNTWRDMPNTSLAITLPWVATLICLGSIQEFGTGTYGFFEACFNINAADVVGFNAARTYGQNAVEMIPIFAIKTGVPAGSRTIKIRENSSAAGYTVNAKQYIVLAIAE
jgi:hypothetical protein